MMKLYFTPASPYARKVRVVAHEKGLAGRMEEIFAHPIDSPGDLNEHNPLGKIPALVTEDGTTLCDSPVIAEYLDTLSDSPKLFPAGATRWEVLNRAALAHGLMDAAVHMVHEIRRPAEEQSAMWKARHESAIWRTLAMFEESPPATDALDIAAINLAVALAYISFRLGDWNWPAKHPALAAWHALFSERPSMKATLPS